MSTRRLKTASLPTLHPNFLRIVRLAYVEVTRKSKSMTIEVFMQTLCDRLKDNRDQSVPRNFEQLYEYVEAALVTLHNAQTITLPPAYLP